MPARSSDQCCLVSDFCSSGRDFAPRFLQTVPRGSALALPLVLHLHQVTQGTFTPKLSDMSDTQAGAVAPPLRGFGLDGLTPSRFELSKQTKADWERSRFESRTERQRAELDDKKFPQTKRNFKSGRILGRSENRRHVKKIDGAPERMKLGTPMLLFQLSIWRAGCCLKAGPTV